MLPRTAFALALGLLCAGLGGASADIREWDPEKVATLAERLRLAAHDLYDAFYKQPVLGVAQNKFYYRLKQDIRSIRIEAGQLSDELAKGAGRDETLPIWENLMQDVRRATDHAASVFTTHDVDQKAQAARAILDQLAPYYAGEAATSEPPAR
jgi:hypothetical protein